VPPWVKNELWRRARAVPSLDQRFAESKSLVDAVSGQQLITFNRASSGTVTDSAGVIQTAATDVPRFDHDPTTGESLGLLVEEQRTNLLLQSENLGTTWTPGAILAFGSGSTLNAATAPDGTSTADLITEDTSTSTHLITQGSLSFTSGSTYTLSCFVKRGTGSRNAAIQVRAAAFGSSHRVNIDLSTGATSFAGSGVTFGSQSYLNGWWRVFMTATATATVSSFVDIGTVSGASTLSYTGDGTSGIHLWGADLQAASTPSSYIPTTTAAVTRSASLADLISSAIANNIRTLYLEFRSPASGTRGVASLNDNTANERASVLTSGTDPRLVVVDGGVEQANVNGGTVTANQRTRIAVRINANDFAISINGGAVVTDTSGTLPTVDRLMLGRTQAGEYLNGTIARATGWTQLLPDSTLQSLAQ
jgi:hypothetical protein